MNWILSAPRKFVIGDGEIGRLAQHVGSYGTPLLLVAHPDDAKRVRPSLELVQADGVELVEGGFNGEASRAEAERFKAICREKACKAVIGLGGGKAIDIGKLVAHEQGLPVVIIPTIASNDAPCSKLAVLYKESHEYAETVVLPTNPDLVVVDSGVIARAPERFLVAGMGDAFATYYEGRACMRAGALNYNGGLATNAAFAMAEVCRKILLEDGKKALLACRAKLVNQALTNVIEANILLSGIGFESVGLACAHAIQAGFTAIPDTQAALHGEAVAVGTLVQLIMENAPVEELREVYDFYRSIGLPTSLSALGLKLPFEEKIRSIAGPMAQEGSLVHNMPFTVDEEMLYNALLSVESLDKLFEKTA